MKIDLKLIHYVQLALGATVAACGALASDPALAPTCHAISSVAGSLLGILAVLSPPGISKEESK